jgi:peptide deformylase
MAFRKNKTGAGGAPLEQVRVFGDPVLKQQTREVSEFDKRLATLAKTMFEIMERQGGIGLAAPQIGSLCRMMVWKNPEDDDRQSVYVNPRVVSASDATTTEDEGCLSVPGVTMPVARADEITVEACDLKGRPFTVELKGFPARIAQHEIDHLEGTLIVDRTPQEERRRVLKELREQSIGSPE